MMFTVKLMVIRFKMYLNIRFGNKRTLNRYNFDWRMKNKIRQALTFSVMPTLANNATIEFNRVVSNRKLHVGKMPKLGLTYNTCFIHNVARLCLNVFFREWLPIVKMKDKFSDHRTKQMINRKIKSVFDNSIFRFSMLQRRCSNEI